VAKKAKVNKSRMTEILDQVSAEMLEGAKITMQGGKMEFESEVHQVVARTIGRIKALIQETGKEQE
jgi:hypothetical protein